MLLTVLFFTSNIVDFLFALMATSSKIIEGIN